MSTKKKTEKKSTAKKAAKAPKKMGAKQSDKIRDVLSNSKGPKTVREICKVLHLPNKNAKFVSSFLIHARGIKAVTVKKKICPITGRTVNAFMLNRKSA